MPQPLLFFRRALTSLAAVALSFHAGSAHAAKDTVPDWVRAVIAQPAEKYPADTSAVVLLDEITFKVDADGKAVEHRRRIVKILRPAGRKEGIIHLSFDKDKKILSFHVWSVGPDGQEYAVKDKDVVEKSFGSGNLYDDTRYKIVDAPGRDPGGVIAEEYEQRAEPYMHEATWFFQDEYPHQQQSFTLELAPGYTYKTVFAHHADQPATDLEKQRYRWQMDKTPGIDLEQVPMSPSIDALAGRMTVHYGASSQATDQLATWQGIGTWFDGLAHDRTAATPEISAKATELTAGKTDFYDKAEAIGEYVQQHIRYFDIEMGVGGYQPHAAADIFRNQYGDCKDKATLLSAMLSSVGIHSAIMIVDDKRGVIDPAAPSIVADHAIGAIEVPVGYNSPKLRSLVTAKSGRRYLIFDPTWEKTAFGQLENNLQGSYGMLMEAQNSEIVELPVLRPEWNTLHRSAAFTLESDGSLKGKITEERFGDISEDTRYLYSMGDQRMQQTYMDRRLGQDFSSFTVSDVKVADVTALNKPVVTTYSLVAPKYGRNMGPLLMVRPRVMGSEGFQLDRKQRKIPIDLAQTMQTNDDFTIALPSGYALDELPEPVKLDVGFASYESSTRMDGNSLHYTRTYTVRQITVPAERYDDVRKLEAAIEADEQNHAVFKKQ